MFVAVVVKRVYSEWSDEYNRRKAIVDDKTGRLQEG